MVSRTKRLNVAERRPAQSLPANAAPGERPRRAYSAAVAAAVLILATVAAYSNSLDGALILDDKRQIIENPRVRQVWPLSQSFSGSRPVVDFSFALDHALGSDLRLFHATNLVIHLAAALTLFGLVRRTLERMPAGRTRPFPPVAIAWAAAILWSVHPLNTESVTYLVQRAESLMGFLYLFTLYAIVRHTGSARPHAWTAAAVAACALGMASKAVMVTAPVLALLFDRVMVSGSWLELLRRRRFLHAGLAATWLVLWWCGAGSVLSTANPTATVGFSYKGVTPLEYALTQPGVILHYLFLSLWPYPLCLDYGWPAARTVGAVLPAALAIVALGGAVVWAWFRRATLALTATAFFVILGPTSSFIPIRDLAFEHRMYLPLAAVAVVAVMGGASLAAVLWRSFPADAPLRSWMGGAVVGAASLGLILSTYRRNEDYRDLVGMWETIARLRPNHARARFNLGTLRLERGELEPAAAEFAKAATLDAPMQHPHLWAQAHYQIAKVRSRQGREDEAAVHYADALRIDGTLVEARSDLGVYLVGRGRIDEGLEQLRESVRMRPDYAPAQFNLGKVLLDAGRIDEAVAPLRAAAALSPANARILFALGEALVRQGNADEGRRALRRAQELDPEYVRRKTGG